MIAVKLTYEEKQEGAGDDERGPFCAQTKGGWIGDALRLVKWQSQAARFVSIGDTIAAVSIIRDECGLDGHVFKVFRDVRYPVGKIGTMVHVGEVSC